MSPARRRLRFGPFELDPLSGELWKDGAAVPNQRQPARVLAMLVERPGVCVTREEIRAQIWRDHHVNFNQGLNYCIRQVRRALGERAGSTTYIQTVAGSGYRWIAAVEETTGGIAGALAPAVPTVRRSVPPWVAAAVGALAVIAVGGAHHLIERPHRVERQSREGRVDPRTSDHHALASAVLRSLGEDLVSPGADPGGARFREAVRTLWTVTASHIGLASDSAR